LGIAAVSFRKIVSTPQRIARLVGAGGSLTDRRGVHTARMPRWEQRARAAVASGRVFPYLAATTASLAVLVGFIATLIDRKDFPTFGAGLWWAIVTLGTVGYGDIVPTTAWGRVLGGFVIVVGVTFISFLTATVTSYFVSVDQEAEQAREHEFRAASDNETRELLRQLDSRLAAIERTLGTAPPD
jgi:voltage-gated potassium channel